MTLKETKENIFTYDSELFTPEELEEHGNIVMYESQLKTIEDYLKYHKLAWNHESTLALAVMLQTGVLKLGDGWDI